MLEIRFFQILHLYHASTKYYVSPCNSEVATDFIRNGSSFLFSKNACCNLTVENSKCARFRTQIKRDLKRLKECTSYNALMKRRAALSKFTTSFIKSLDNISLGFCRALLGRSTRLLIVCTGVAVALNSTGCLVQSNYPGLPYVRVQPARSGPAADYGRVQLAARMESLEVELRQVRDQLERLQAVKGHEREIVDLQRRVVFLEQLLAIEPDPTASQKMQERSKQQSVVLPEPVGQGDQAATTEAEQPHTQASRVVIRNTPISNDEQAFRQAYALIRKGTLKDAEPLMREFIKQYKQSKYAANAVYWIGEALYARGKYSEAVLEFDRVIKEYPGSEKELSALLKQGQAFEKMGDSESAKIILEKLIKKHPHTAQARLAKSRLSTVKKNTSRNQ